MVAVGLLVGLTALAGCAAFPFVGPTCGLGETDVGTVDGDASDVSFKGEVTAVDDTRFVLDDGTGETAVLLVGYDSSRVSTGDCVVAHGSAAERETGDSEVLPVPTELYGEEVVVEDE